MVLPLEGQDARPQTSSHLFPARYTLVGLRNENLLIFGFLIKLACVFFLTSYTVHL